MESPRVWLAGRCGSAANHSRSRTWSVARTDGFDQCAVTGDGQRFLLLELIESEAKPFTIVLNWPAAVKR